MVRRLALVLLAVGCKGSAPEAAKPSNSAAATVAVDTALSPSTQLGPSRPLGEWVNWMVADTGFGPIVIGMTPDQANTAVGGALALPDSQTIQECGYAFPRGMDSVAFMIEAGRIVRTDVHRHDVQTREGARVGDTEERIHELYAGRVRVSPHPYTGGHYLTILPPDTVAHPYLLIFETDGKVVESYRGGALHQVKYIEGCS